MGVPLYLVHAFTDAPFSGNPAAVCFPDRWPEASRMQQIAAENRVSETAFLLPREEGWDLRWFAPGGEVDLCGHATLASAHVLFHLRGSTAPELRFFTRSGTLTARRDGDRTTMRLPARAGVPCAPDREIIDALGRVPQELYRSRDYMAVFESEEEIRALKPDFDRLMDLDALGMIVTAPGREADFVSRFFVPRLGVPEDPVTGSAHCTLIPYWHKRLDRRVMVARQLSERGGTLFCEDDGETVTVGGNAVVYLEGSLSDATLI